MKRQQTSSDAKPNIAETAYWTNLGIFNAHRGRLKNLAKFLEEIVSDESSAYFGKTARELQKSRLFSGDLQVLVTKLIQLRMMEKRDFANEVLWALTRPNYLLPGEKSFSRETTAMTLIVLDPKRTFFLLRGLLAGIFHWEMPSYVQFEQHNYREFLHLGMHRLFEIFPSMKKYADERIRLNHGTFYHDDPNYVLRSAYLMDVVAPFWEHLKKMIFAHGYAYPPPFYLQSNQMNICVRGGMGRFDGKNSTWDLDMHAADFGKNFAFAMEGGVAEVLSKFPRRLRNRIAAWQFQMPNNLGERFPGDFYFGIHEESEHGLWKKRWPVFVSQGFGGGVSHGYGSICIPDESYQELREEYRTFGEDKSGEPFRALFTTW